LTTISFYIMVRELIHKTALGCYIIFAWIENLKINYLNSAGIRGKKIVSWRC
jgi:hypothetical protein